MYIMFLYLEEEISDNNNNGIFQFETMNFNL